MFQGLRLLVYAKCIECVDLTAAFSSGSSNGSATSTAASFAAFGLGSETVSSGRSPASNNALVAYTPSRCVISPRGIWPLYPTCDVVVPQTRTVKDMLGILDILTAEDSLPDGDFWRQQNFVEIPKVARPKSFRDLACQADVSLRGKRIAVPKMYIGGHDPQAKPTVVSTGVIDLWKQAQIDLETLGATVIATDFPLVTNYEDDSVSGQANNVRGFKPDWNGKERGELVAYLWDDFVKEFEHPDFSKGLAEVDGTQMFPRPDGYIPDRYMEHKNFINYPGIVELCQSRNGKSIWEVDGINQALPALEAQRKRDLEGWMDDEGLDMVVFPANGDVGRADLETNDESARHALQNGVKYSNGNRALRHMGVPTVSVTMGIVENSKMPVNLTFAGKHGQDVNLLKVAYAFEERTRRRIAPPVVPAITSDSVTSKAAQRAQLHTAQPLRFYDVVTKRLGSTQLLVASRVEGVESDTPVQFEAWVDGKAVPDSTFSFAGGKWSFEAEVTPFEPKKPLYGGVGEVVGNFNIILLGRRGSEVTAKLIMVPQDTDATQ